jgi:hypothetical protein
MTVLRDYDDFCSTRRPRPEPGRAAASLPDGVTDFDPLWVQRRHRTGGVHEYCLVA